MRKKQQFFLALGTGKDETKMEFLGIGATRASISSGSLGKAGVSAEGYCSI